MTQFTHVSRDFEAKSRKQTKKSFEKNVLLMWSQICGKMALIVRKITLKNKLFKIWTSRGIFWRYAICDAITGFVPKICQRLLNLSGF